MPRLSTITSASTLKLAPQENSNFWYVSHGTDSTASDQGVSVKFKNDFIYVAGKVRTSASTATDYHIKKMNKYGHLIWSQVLVTSNPSTSGNSNMSEEAYGIAIDSNGDVISCGRQIDYDGVTPQDVNGIVTKMNGNDGSLLWSTKVSFTSQSGKDIQLNDVCVDSSNNIYVLGTADNGAFSSSGIYLAKYNTNGGIEWQKYMAYDNANGATLGHSICSDDANNRIILTGRTQVSGQGGYDMLIAAVTTSNHTVVWQKTVGGVNNDYGNAIALGDSGEFYTVTSFDNNASTTNRTEIVLSNWDSNCNLNWSRKYGTVDNNDYAYGVAYDASTLYISGTTFSGYGSADLWIARANDTDGSLQWQYLFGGSNADSQSIVGNPITIDPDGHPITTFGCSSASSGSYDTSILKITKSGASVSVIDGANNNPLGLFPAHLSDDAFTGLTIATSTLPASFTGFPTTDLFSPSETNTITHEKYLLRNYKRLTMKTGGFVPHLQSPDDVATITIKMGDSGDVINYVTGETYTRPAGIRNTTDLIPGNLIYVNEWDGTQSVGSSVTFSIDTLDRNNCTEEYIIRTPDNFNNWSGSSAIFAFGSSPIANNNADLTILRHLSSSTNSIGSTAWNNSGSGSGWTFADNSSPTPMAAGTWYYIKHVNINGTLTQRTIIDVATRSIIFGPTSSGKTFRALADAEECILGWEYNTNGYTQCPDISVAFIRLRNNDYRSEDELTQLESYLEFLSRGNL